jgi:hypothetical protein
VPNRVQTPANVRDRQFEASRSSSPPPVRLGRAAGRAFAWLSGCRSNPRARPSPPSQEGSVLSYQARVPISRAGRRASDVDWRPRHSHAEPADSSYMTCARSLPRTTCCACFARRGLRAEIPAGTFDPPPLIAKRLVEIGHEVGARLSTPARWRQNECPFRMSLMGHDFLANKRINQLRDQ